MKFFLHGLLLFSQMAWTSNLTDLEGQHSLDVVADARIRKVLESPYNRVRELS